MSGSTASPPGRSTGKRPDRLQRRSQIAGIVGASVAVVGLLVALLSWRFPVIGSDDEAAPSPTTPTRPITSTTSTTSTPTGGPEPGESRFLTDLEPDTGAGFVQRVGAHSLLMRCGGGGSTDRYREVEYEVPRVGYRTFRSTAAAAGERDSRVQVFVRVDGQVVAEPVLTAGSTMPLEWTGEGVGRLTLRVQCEAGASAVTFTDPVLRRP